MYSQQYLPPNSFKHWLRQDKENRSLIWISVITMAICFTGLKILYPYPNFMPPDSDTYIESAANNSAINIWPIGYSKFIRLISSFTNSHFLLILIQYLLLMLSGLYFLFTIKYWVHPGKWSFRIMLGCFILNPLLVQISNFVSSDSLFTTLSIVWFTQLIWIIYQPMRSLLILHAVILVLAFTVRHNAIYYPCISILIILYTQINKKVKRMGIGCIILFISIFIGYTQYHYYKETGTIQYSAFGGWQIAANALYGYAYSKPDARKNIPVRFRELHAIVNQHMDSLRHLRKRPDDEVAIYYQWDEKSPLYTYMHYKFKDDSTPFFIRYAGVAPLYASYGSYIIRKHPIAFLAHYAWPNLKKFYAPPTKFMGLYNLGHEKVSPTTVTWFGWKNDKIHTFFRNKRILMTEYFTGIMAAVNLVFILSLIGLIGCAGIKYSTSYGKGILWWIVLIWFCNMVFSVLSAPIEMRYQLFPMIFTLTFGIALIARMIQFGRNMSLIENQNEPAIVVEQITLKN